MSTDYDKDLINREVVAICDHYLTSKRGEGKRQTYLCPACGDRNFEVDPQLGYAGCFDAACEVPKSTDALGIIAYFERKDLSGEGFVMCLKKGYEILGIPDPEEEGDKLHSSANGDRPKAMTARKEKKGHRQKAMTPRADRRGNNEEVPDNGTASSHSRGPQWAAATSVPSDTSGTALTEQPIQAWQENDDGTRSAVAAVVIREPDPETESEDAEELEEAELAEESQRQTERTDDRQTAHQVFEELLRLCRREERDEAFLKDRGLDQAAIEEGRFGSISKSRCNYVISRLRKKFSDEALLSVPGFRKAESGQIRFSLYGDYVLMPYYDGEGYIRTVEGRFTGEEMGEYDKKYKALLNSAVHLYVHPRHKPSEVVAICEGAIGAMVAARYGFAVASIKGMRNYRCRADGRLYSVLPELAGVNFAGKVVVYIPDLDVKPQTREEAFSLVPEACQWMIERQGGVAKVAMLPDGAKDLDAWISSVDEEEREQKIGELISGALPLEQWKRQYLNTGTSQDDGQPEFEEIGGEDEGEGPVNSTPTDTGTGTDDGGSGSGSSGSGHDERNDVEEAGGGGAEEKQEQAPNSEEKKNSSRKSSGDYETGAEGGDGKDPGWEQLQLETGEGFGQKTEDDTTQSDTTEDDDTTELEVRYTQQEDTTEQRKPEEQDEPEDEEEGEPPGIAYRAAVKGQRHLFVVVYVVAALMLSIAAWSLLGGLLTWASYLVAGAGLAIPVAIGSAKLLGWRHQRQMKRHIEGNN